MFAIKKIKARIHSKISPPEGTKLNELDEKRPGTSQMSERLGPNFAPGSFALQALSRGRNRATRATRDNQDAHTEIAHTHSATETKHNSQPETTKGSWPLLLLLLLLCCCCFTTRDASRSTTRHNILFLVFCFLELTQKRVTAQQQQQQHQVQQQGRPKHMYEYTIGHQAG